jgi:hypothetical protein
MDRLTTDDLISLLQAFQMFVCCMYVCMYVCMCAKVVHKLSGEHLAIVRGVAAQAVPAGWVRATESATHTRPEASSVGIHFYFNNIHTCMLLYIHTFILICVKQILWPRRRMISLSYCGCQRSGIHTFAFFKN